jgi:membrane protein DedA with SNARE-associated domain
VAELAPKATASGGAAGDSGINGFWGDFLSALILYGYPALALVLLLGAIGLPLPTGLSTALAGSLVAQGHMSWLLAGSIAVAASVAGDSVGYGLGRLLSGAVLERQGRWIGFTPARQEQAARLIAHWGAMGIILSRTLLSSVSPAFNLVAGAGRFRPLAFVALALLGRGIWTGAYLGAGYLLEGNLEAANRFLGNLSGFLIALAVFGGTMLMEARLRAPRAEGSAPRVA